MVSSLPLTTRVGWLMARRMACSGSGVAHQVISALACGSVTALPLSVSRSSLRTFARFRKARPDDWLGGRLAGKNGAGRRARVLWGDAAAERKAQQVDLRKAEQIDEDDGISRHGFDIVRRLTGRAT